MAWTDEEKDTFRRRFLFLFNSIEIPAYTKSRGWELAGITDTALADGLNDELELIGQKLRVHSRTVTRFKKGECFLRSHQSDALYRFLVRLMWTEGRELQALIGTMRNPGFPEKEWRESLDRCRPTLRLSDKIDSETNMPKLVKMVRAYNVIRYGLLPSELPVSGIGAINKRSRLVEQVQEKMNLELSEPQRSKLTSFLYQCDEGSLKRMRDKGGCEAWEAFEVLKETGERSTVKNG